MAERVHDLMGPLALQFNSYKLCRKMLFDFLLASDRKDIFMELLSVDSGMVHTGISS